MTTIEHIAIKVTKRIRDLHSTRVGNRVWVGGPLDYNLVCSEIESALRELPPALPTQAVRELRKKHGKLGWAVKDYQMGYKHCIDDLRSILADARKAAKSKAKHSCHRTSRTRQDHPG